MDTATRIQRNAIAELPGCGEADAIGEPGESFTFTLPSLAFCQRHSVLGSLSELALYKVFQFAKSFITLFLFASSIAMADGGVSNNNLDKNTTIKIHMVNFNLSTIRAVPCNEFLQRFDHEVKTAVLRDESDIARFHVIFNNLKSGGSGCPDTRAIVLIHNQNGDAGVLCVSHTGLSLNENPILPSEEMVRFIENVVIRQLRSRPRNAAALSKPPTH